MIRFGKNHQALPDRTELPVFLERQERQERQVLEVRPVPPAYRASLAFRERAASQEQPEQPDPV